MRRAPLLRSLSTLLCCWSFAACSGGELVGVHIDLAADGSGRITTRALTQPKDPAQIEVRSVGADWTLRAALVASQGTFRDIGALQIGDAGVQFAPDLTSDRPGVRVTLQRGPDAAWIHALVPGAADRRKLAAVYDPTGRTKEIAEVLRIEIQAPGQVVTSGVLPAGRGVESGEEAKRAFLLLPVTTALEAGDPFVWDVSWLKAQ